MNSNTFRTLDELQLIRLMNKGQDIAECQAEWFRRWGRPYPWRKIIRGWERAV